MQRSIFVVLILFLLPFYTYVNKKENVARAEFEIDETYQLYSDMNLKAENVDYSAFEQAMIGYNAIEDKKKEIITLIDFTKPSSEERLFVMDINHKKLLYSSLVAHGRNSGNLYATSFSNVNGSYKSSLGFFITENTYYGSNGYSLVLNGLEKGINDLAKQRAIVVHGSAYCNPSVIKSSGRLGRSLGCPALPKEISEDIINTIKGGSLMYIYADSENYLTNSNILHDGELG